MAKKNPFLNIDRLRQESGAEEVIPESSLDQYDPATSYKLGTSTLAVDMTPSDWPWLGKGIVNTSRVDDNFATQTFAPYNSNKVFQRRWDDSPFSPDDDFDSGISPSTSKYVVLNNPSGMTWDVDSGSMRFQTNATVSAYWCMRARYELVGDFRVTFRVKRSFSQAPNGWHYLVFTQAQYKDETSVNTGTDRSPAGWASTDGNKNDPVYYQGMNGASHSDGNGNYTWTDDTWREYRIERVGSTITWYKKDGGDADWLLERGPTPNGRTTNLVPKWFQSGQSGATHLYDSWTVESLNTGSIVWDVPNSTAYWSGWVELPTVEESQQQAETAATVAVSTHEAAGHGAVSGTFTTTDGKTITVTNGIITSIV